MKSKKEIVLDDALWLKIDQRKKKLVRDEFIAKILAHALGLSHGGFEEKL